MSSLASKVMKRPGKLFPDRTCLHIVLLRKRLASETNIQHKQQARTILHARLGALTLYVLCWGKEQNIRELNLNRTTAH